MTLNGVASNQIEVVIARERRKMSSTSTPPPPTPPPSGSGASGSGSSAATAANSGAAADIASTIKAGSTTTTTATPQVKAPPRPIPRGLRPLVYLGIPEAVLRWKPKPPSRNTSIFLTVSTTLISLYVYDRRECKKIRQEYIDQVSHLSQETLQPYEYPRKISVYGAKSPGDDDYDKSILYFKRYVRPVLKAAGIDWEVLNGMRHGGLAREVRERTYARRRQLQGLEPWGIEPSSPGAEIGPPSPDSIEAQAAAANLQSPFSLSPEQQMQRELDGAVVVVGRPAFKEYMWGLKEGWTTKLPSQRQDLNEPIARALENDGKFDELPAEETDTKTLDDGSTSASSSSSPSPSPADSRALSEMDEIERRNRLLADSAADDEGAPLPQSRVSTTPAKGFNSFNSPSSSSRSSSSPSGRPAPNVADHLLEPPAQIPAQAPFVYVPFTNLTGWRRLPRRMVNFFNRRADVRAGGEVALSILLGDKSTAREFDAPRAQVEDPDTNSVQPLVRSTSPQFGDLDLGLVSESTYPPRFHALLKTIQTSRETYYKDLVQKLKDSRSYYRGQRELTSMEKNDPPKTESELRTKRLDREREWRNEEQGFEILTPQNGVAWDERFRGSLRILESLGQKQWREKEAQEVLKQWENRQQQQQQQQ
ncbi:unnamed protein product [Sympodiomycopsis kandeliae]